jgi:hypothetical protein
MEILKMKKIYYISCLIGMVLFTTSCDKHEIEYDTTDVASDVAEFQIHYCAPIVSSTSAYIYQVNINDSLYANSNSPLTPYNAIPNGSVGRFFTAKAGTTNIKMYTGKTSPTLAYNQNCTLKAGKQNIFVYDLNQPPIVFDNGYPYETNTTANTDSTAWVKFYNFMYETTSTPTTMKLQYQYYYVDPITKQNSDTVNVGKPVSFGETTGWQPVKVKKTVFNSSGSISLYYLIKVIDANGNDTGFLQIVNSKGKTVSYSDYWNAYIGRRYHHVLAGIRSVKSPSVAVSVFTAL